jgi:hypothetical protein
MPTSIGWTPPSIAIQCVDGRQAERNSDQKMTHTPDLRQAAPGRAPHPIHWLVLTAALVGIKLAWLVADPTPMLFLGDSESYVWTALTGWVPPDRSFLYGFLLRPLAVMPGSLLPLVVAQAASSVVAALLLAHLLANAFAIPARAAFTVALGWAALEPLALLYERYVMTEAFALVGFAAFVTLSIRYLALRRLRDLLLAQVAATFVIALRTVFVPVALVFALVLPVLAWARRPPGGEAASTRRGLGPALLVSITATLLLHQAYKVVNGRLSESPPAYQYTDGLFLLAAWSPVVSAQDFDDRAIGDAITADSEYRQTNCGTREEQRWRKGCMVHDLVRLVGDDGRANPVARNAAIRALRRDPLGVAGLAFATWRAHFDRNAVHNAMHYDRGEFAFSARLIATLRERFGVAEPAQLHRIATPTNRWYFAAVPWIIFLALAPFIAALALATCPKAARRKMTFVTLLSTCIIGATAFGALGVVPRYLHAIAWLTMIPLTVIAARIARAIRSG